MVLAASAAIAVLHHPEVQKRLWGEGLPTHPKCVECVCIQSMAECWPIPVYVKPGAQFEPGKSRTGYFTFLAPWASRALWRGFAVKEKLSPRVGGKCCFFVSQKIRRRAEWLC